MAARNSSVGEDDIEATVRKFAREEIQSFSGSSGVGVGTLLNRTRSLIQSAAASSSTTALPPAAVQSTPIRTSMGARTRPRPNLSLSSSGMLQGQGGQQRRIQSVTGHPYRPLKKRPFLIRRQLVYQRVCIYSISKWKMAAILKTVTSRHSVISVNHL
eukprot:gene11659-12863_t